MMRAQNSAAERIDSSFRKVHSGFCCSSSSLGIRNFVQVLLVCNFTEVNVTLAAGCQTCQLVNYYVLIVIWYARLTLNDYSQLKIKIKDDTACLVFDERGGEDCE